MANTVSAMLRSKVDCVVVGAGPAGLAAVRALLEGGAGSVLVIERDEAPGGLPQYCRHPGFGWGYTRRLETGPAFARRMAAVLSDQRVTFLPRTTATVLREGPVVEMLGPDCGAVSVSARTVLLATGIRERPRGARLVPGQRPERGVLTTGQLQQMVARGVPLPGPRMVVVGTEHVAFSVLLTARHAGCRIVAMIEEGERVSSYTPLAWVAEHFARVPIHLGARIAGIVGRRQVEAVEIESAAGRRTIACDGVVFSGSFVPDAVLARTAGIALDAATGGPSIDQYGRTSLDGVFAAGNVLRPVETSGFCAIEGSRVGANIADHLCRSRQWDGCSLAVNAAPPAAYIVPQRWALDHSYPKAIPTSLRSLPNGTGNLTVTINGKSAWRAEVGQFMPQRRIRVPETNLRNTALSTSPNRRQD